MLGSMRLAGRWAAALVTVAAVAGTAAGCSSSGSAPVAAASSAASSAPSSAASSASAVATSAAAASPAAVSSSAAPAVSSSAAASPSVSPSASSAAPPKSATAACPTRYLAAKVGFGQGAAGSVYQIIDFTNIANVSCTLYGYPGVSLAGGSPVTQIGAAANRGTTSRPSVVTLAPGATASALLRITQALNYPPATCSPTSATYLQIYPPDQFTPIYLAYRSTGCAKTGVKLMSISVITPGTGG